MDGDAEVFCGAVTAELGVHFLDVECLRESHGSSFAVTGDLDAEEAGRLPHNRDVVAFGVWLEEVGVDDSAETTREAKH
eukprot:scaffold16910_cov134-Isochrysis_galbana.AAC.3